MLNRNRTSAGLLTGGTLLVVSAALAVGASNVGGDYATQFVPATVTGTVTDAQGDVEAALVATIAGHGTRTAAGGSYTLHFAAPGIYTVRASSGAKRASGQIEVERGATATLDLFLGASLDGAADALGAALSTRLAALDDPVPKENRKEAKYLRKARKALLHWQAPDKRGLKALQKTIGFLKKAASVDAAVVVATDGLLASLAGHAEAQAVEADAALARLTVPKHTKTVQKLITKAAAAMGKARSQAAAAKQAKFYVKAILGYDKALAKAAAFRTKESR